MAAANVAKNDRDRAKRLLDHVNRLHGRAKRLRGSLLAGALAGEYPRTGGLAGAWGVIPALRTMLVLGALPVAASAQSFTLIPLPSGETGTRAYGVSADGSVVAGSSANAAGLGPGWTWTASGGLNVFGQTEPGLPPDTWAAGISGDGNTVVGQSGGAQISDPKLPYIYRGPGTFQTLPLVDPFYTQGRATDASYDGSVVVGYDNEVSISEASQAFRWTADGGMQGLGWTRGSHYYSHANAISADGNTVVGSSGGGGDLYAFIWTPQTGIRELPGERSSEALGSAPMVDLWLAGHSTRAVPCSGTMASWKTSAHRAVHRPALTL